MIKIKILNAIIGSKMNSRSILKTKIGANQPYDSFNEDGYNNNKKTNATSIVTLLNEYHQIIRAVADSDFTG